jgi:altronate hydrolase
MSRTAPEIVKLNSDDDVVLALKAIPAGGRPEALGLKVLNDIPAGHKIAVKDIPQGGLVKKYGQVIGKATRDIKAGQHVHKHNLGMAQLSGEYEIGTESSGQPVPAESTATFEGIVRPDGRIATRNYIGVLATCNCSSGVARMIADRFKDVSSAYPNIDGVVAIKQGWGCGMGGHGEGFEYLQNSLAGWTSHPNFAGVVLVGLGCEVNNLDCFMGNMHLESGENLVRLNIQDGGTPATIEKGVEAIQKMLPHANQAKRQTLPASKLVLALECGGSDAYSGLAANPALGKASDLLVAQGGTVILGETTEIYGAEHLLIRRAVSREVGEKLIKKIKWWEEYTKKLGSEIDNNPSPGNIEGGLTTILEKSLGAMAKAGTSNLTQVYDYAQKVNQKGLVFMDTPGYDVVSITGMIAGGANVVCFTTGRGTVFGSKPVPTLKLASNTPMYERMVTDMDINCGPIVTGESTVDQKGREIFEAILATASGQKSKSEAHGFGDDEYVPWQIGAVV